MLYDDRSFIIDFDWIWLTVIKEKNVVNKSHNMSLSNQTFTKKYFIVTDWFNDISLTAFKPTLIAGLYFT